MAGGAIRDILERSIDELPDELRTVFVACVVDGITPEQFAELSALTSETVNARLHNARNFLVEVLVRQFGPAFGGVYELTCPLLENFHRCNTELPHHRSDRGEIRRRAERLVDRGRGAESRQDNLHLVS